MKRIILHIDVENDPNLIAEVTKALDKAGIEIVPSKIRIRGVITPDIIIALTSAGGFTMLYQIISSILNRNKEKELVIERDGIKVSLKGFSIPEEKKLLELVAPELTIHERKNLRN